MKQATGIFLIASMLLADGVNTRAQAQEVDNAQSHGSHEGGMHHGNMRGFGDPERMLERMSQHLDLDATQVQLVSNVFLAAKPEIDVLRDELHVNREAMNTLATSDPNYPAELQNLASANADLAAQMTMLQGRLRADIASLLTAEQQEKMQSRGRHRRHN